MAKYRIQKGYIVRFEKEIVADTFQAAVDHLKIMELEDFVKTPAKVYIYDYDHVEGDQVSEDW